MKNIFAFAENRNDYPAYVFLDITASGRFELTVRTRGNGGMMVATIELSPQSLEHLANDILNYLHRANHDN